ncbi:AraC family transcriptional regulator [Arenicella sp. 4NH20-0111]|uniref:AraC family transcriptional regulator n=1 Tax=Arenicella sp. 4NH20-0111 TaxID=3127648 RepID=UPI0031026F9B
MKALNQLFKALNVRANVFHNGQYFGSWAVDTSGSGSTSFHLVTHGNCVISVSGQQHHLRAGDAIFLPNDAEHTISDSFNTKAQTNQQCSVPMTEPLQETSTGLICGNLINEHPLGASLMRALPPAIVIKHDKHASCSALIALLLEEARRADQGAHFLLDHLADALFFILIRDHANASSGLLAAILHPQLRPAIELIHQNADKPLSNESLADAAAMSRSAFAAQFKHSVGMPPAEYQTQWRMLRAYRWLADEQISTLDAALKSGYESEASFSKAFKRIIGIGPGEARRQ